MKKRYIILAVSILFLYNSCADDFLSKDPEGSVGGKLFENQQGIDLLSISAYSTLVSRVNGKGPYQASPFNWVFGGVYGGDANKGSDPGDQSVVNEIELYKILPTNEYLDQKWSWMFMGVQRVNLVFTTMKKVDNLPDDFVKARSGEMKYLKALFYFEGIRVFGPYIPWIPETNMENHPKIHNDIDIWENVLADIDEAISKLPDTQAQVGRPNVWAAKALKAKMLVTRGELDKALPLLAEVVSSGVTSNGLKYALEDALDKNFNTFTENGRESVFAVQFSSAAEDTGNVGYALNYPHNSGPGGCCGFYQPSFELVNSFQVDDKGLPYLDNEYRVKPSVSVLRVGGAQNDPIAINDKNIAVDPRLDFAVGRYEIPYKDWGFPKNDWIRNPVNGGIFLPKKHVFSKAEEDAGFKTLYGGWAPGSAMNIQYLSLRDLKLLYAECLAATGNLSGAMAQVNDIRRRAANPLNIIKLADGTPAAKYLVNEYPSSHVAFSNKDICIKAVRMERKLELAMESERWFDLKRWGGEYMREALADYVRYETQYIGKFAAASELNIAKTMFPVPQEQIETQGSDPMGKPYLVQPAPWK